jgi:hypothetical protein
MSTTTDAALPTEFINIQVLAIPSLAPDKKTVHYDVSFVPPYITVKTLDAVINYQLVAPSPSGVKFKNMTVKPHGQQQFSASSISQSGKLITFSDANSVTETLEVTIYFEDADGIRFSIDPQVINDPRP